jgi:hypothetical protein
MGAFEVVYGDFSNTLADALIAFVRAFIARSADCL